MAVEWTQEERKNHLKKKFYSHKVRLIISFVCLLVFSIQLYLTSYLLSKGYWLWFFVFLVALIVSGVIIIFVIDFIFFGAE